MSFEFDFSGRSYYVPSAFYISAAPGVLDDVGTPLPGGWHRLMHEYAHLIQDRTSVFGAIDFLHFVDSLQSVLQLLKVQEDAEKRPRARLAQTQIVKKKPYPPIVQLPVSATKGAADSWVASIRKLRAATYPRKPWKNGVMWAFEEHRIDGTSVCYGGAERHIPIAVARFVDNLSGKTYEHEIGPQEIKEAYSVAIEVLHGGPEVANANEFEYLAIERILGKGGAVDERQIAAICHWALQDSVPGVRFFEIVAFLEKNGPLPAAFDLYDELRQQALNSGIVAKIDNVGKQLDEIVKIQSLSGPKDLMFQVFRWYRDQAVAALARNLEATRRFPLDTYLCEAGHHPDAAKFAAAVAEEPIPVVETSSGAIFAFGGRSVDSHNVLFIRSLSDLISHLWSNPTASWPCILDPTCLLEYHDADCKTRPWDKGAKRPTCPYGAASAYMGFPHLRTLP